ncbi:MAG: hypothetical protein NTZ65_02430 [Candidatus Berkelbacteria bacterium]|nr:hypothetical protein [Candidatus Berkelbacteria bacterium]
MKYWAKDREGNIYEKCIRCDSNSKKHFARGRCHNCYHKWLADNNPEYKEKLRIKDRLKDKRRRQTEKFKIKEREKDRAKRVKKAYEGETSHKKEVELLQTKYHEANRKIDEELKYIEQQSVAEKEEVHEAYEYIKKLESRIGFYDAPKIKCPFCNTDFLFEWPRKSKPMRSHLTKSNCPNCNFNPVRDGLCMRCNRVIINIKDFTTTNNYPICNDCLHIINNPSRFLGFAIKDFHNYCVKCGARLSYRVEEPSLCWNCNDLYNEKGKDPYECDKEWVEIETDDSGGEYRFERLPMLEAPYTAIKYFSQPGSPKDHEFILNLKHELSLSLKIEDLGNPLGYLMYKSTMFTSKNKEKILNRMNQKIVKWEIENGRKTLDYFGNDLQTTQIFSGNISRQEYREYKSSIIARYNPRNLGSDDSLSKKLTDDEVVSINIEGLSFYNLQPTFRKFLNSLIRESENEIRFEVGVPAIGEGWVSETELFHKIKEICEQGGLDAIHHARPEWLGIQHLDIFIPKLNIAIEYQGKQHSEPVDFFGGEEAHLKTLERDKKKKELCDQNNIELNYVNEGDDIELLIKDLHDRIVLK